MVKLDEINAQIKEKILEMANRVIKMHILALETIQDDDAEKGLKVLRMDVMVNADEEEINNMVLESLALLSPVAKDLRNVVSAIKISSELERIGDYAKNVVAFTLKKGRVDDEIKEQIIQIGNIFISMLDHTMEAYDKGDVKLAMSIPDEDEQINIRYRQVIDELSKRLKTDEDLTSLLYVFSLTRNLERAGDHTKNICEHIIYQIKGQHIEFN